MIYLPGHAITPVNNRYVSLSAWNHRVKKGLKMHTNAKTRKGHQWSRASSPFVLMLRLFASKCHHIFHIPLGFQCVCLSNGSRQRMVGDVFCIDRM